MRGAQPILDLARTRPAATIILVFLLSRTVVLAAAHAGAALMTEERRKEWAWIPGKSDLFRGPPPPEILAPLVRWDANFYLSIAGSGYPERPNDDRPVYAVAFFPLYPLAVRAVGGLVGNLFWAAILVANAFALLASFLLFAIGRTHGAIDGGLRAAVLLLIAPGSHFLSLPYPEAMFVAFVATALLALSKEKLWLAAAFGALAGAARSGGVVVALCLLYLAWTRRGSLRNSVKAVAAAVLSLSGVAALALFCQHQYGDPLAFVHIQARYVNDRSIKLLGPVQALLGFDVDPDYYLVTLAALFVCVQMIRRAPTLHTLTAWFLLLLPMWTGTLKAMIRYQSSNVGLLLGTARMGRPRSFAVIYACCLLLLVIETTLFGMGIGHY